MNEENIEVNEEENSQSKLQEQYMESLQKIQEGQLLEGTVVEVGDDFVFVDVGYKSEGKIQLSEFDTQPKMGDTVSVILLKKESRSGEIIISKSKADQILFWNSIKEAYNKHIPISGTIARSIKGGFAVDLGNSISAFMPLSQADNKKVTDVKDYIGLDSKFYIERLSRGGNTNIVLSRRAWLKDNTQRKLEDFFTRVQEGDEVEGVAKNFTSFGVFVDLGGFSGLLHINDISWGRIKSPQSVIKQGQKLKLKVLSLNKEEKKICLSLKHFKENPWKSVDKKYKVGDVIKGRVTKLINFGAFIEVEEGIEGLVHISELSWVKRIRHPKEVLKTGQMVDVKILSYDLDKEKLSLSLKNVYPNPWDDIDKRFPVGMRIKRNVINITNSGLFFQIEEGIDGFLHTDDISWTKKVKNPKEEFKVGDQVEVMIIKIDKKNQKIRLGIKQVSEDPWQSLSKAFPRSSIIEGEVSNIIDTGVFVKVQGEIEGFIRKYNLFDPHLETLEQVLAKYKEGDKIKCIVLEINPKKQRLSLSLKDYNQKIQEQEIEKYLHDDDSPEETVTLKDIIKEKQKE